MTPTVRNTPATRRKFDNLRRIVDVLRKRPITGRIVSDLLCVEASAANRYIRILRNENVIEAAFTKNYTSTYKLTEFPIMLEAFLDRISAPNPSLTTICKPAGKPGRPVTRAPGRYTHTMADDEPFRPHRASLAIPARDPLVAALFGTAGAAREVAA